MLTSALQHLPADVLGLTPLAARALSQGLAFAFLPVPQRVADIPRPAERHDLGERGLLVEAIEQGLAAHDIPDALRDSLSLLAQPNTFVVITGQQPGLLTSPLYSLYKALQTVHLAEQLARRFATPVVPVFWNHADDHDVAEVHHAWQLNHNLDLQKVALAGMSSGRQPVGSIRLDDDHHRLGALGAHLRQLYGDHAHVDEALELFLPRAGETLASAFTRAFTRLLGERGLIVVEPDWIRSELSSGLAHVVGRDPLRALRMGAANLRAAELEPAIDAETAALLFRHGEKGREALRAGGDGFVHENEPGSRSPLELAAEIVSAPRHWSAGALLRPLVQDHVFPVAAYVGGLGELAYHAQLAPLRERCDLPLTPFVPRVSCTLVDVATRDSLDKLGISVRDVLAARGRFAVEESGTAAPPVLGELRAIAARAAAELLEQRAGLATLDRGLAINLKRTADQVRDLVEKVALKGERVFANQSGKGQRHVRRVNHTLFPRETAQERVLGPLAWYARYGRDFVEALDRELPALAFEHLVLELEVTHENRP